MDEVNRCPETPLLWDEDRVPAEEQGVGSEWWVWQPTIAPSRPLRPSKRSPREVMPDLHTGPSTLAAELHWEVWRRGR